MLRRLSLWLHRYVGLVGAVVVVIVSVTGSALVVRDTVEGWLHADEMRVEPGTSQVAVDTVLARVQALDLEREPRLIQFPPSPEHPYAVWLEGPAQERIMVDPYRGAVLGRNTRTEGLMGTLFVWHTELAAGHVGAWIVGLVGLGVVLVSITGLIIAWPGWRRFTRIFIIKWRRRWHIFNYDLHRAGGMWALWFVLLTGATGAGLFFYTSTGEFLDWAMGTESEQAAPPTSAPPPPEAERISLAQAVQQARDALPKATPTFLTLPTTPDAPITVRMRMEGELHPSGRSYAYVDAYRGTILRADNALEAPLSRQVLYALYPLHIGSMGGGWVRVLYVVLGLAPAVLSVTGVIIWLRSWRPRRIAGDPSEGDRMRRAVKPVRREDVMSQR